MLCWRIIGTSAALLPARLRGERPGTCYDPFPPPVTIQTDRSLRSEATTYYDETDHLDGAPTSEGTETTVAGTTSGHRSPVGIAAPETAETAFVTGGLHAACEHLLAALRTGRAVVSADKTLVAEKRLAALEATI